MHYLIRRDGEKLDPHVLNQLDESKKKIWKHEEAGAPDRTAKDIAIASQNFISIDIVVTYLQKRLEVCRNETERFVNDRIPKY